MTQGRDWFEDSRFATQLGARVVDRSGAEPRIQGFDVTSDLARHFTFAEMALIALTGAEPTETVSTALQRALVLLSPIGVESAPSHLGVLTRLVSQSHAASVGTAANVLAQQAAACVAERAQLLDALREGGVPVLGTTTGGTTGSLGALFENCSRIAQQPWFVCLDQLSAAIAILFECGLRENWQLESALFLAWCPCVMAEVGSCQNDPIESYPINLPRFRYAKR